ncbi:DEAD/DEAH box helicase [Candidatus Pacearchaeota archaeon]|nr:DEAD/DEAH box helicase [Candidatus Pacearchaeota archaeon]
MEFLENIIPRKYQEEIFKTCLEKNCLVVLPTGLGKTLIALMVAIERMKEFPGKKVLFLAPTRPLAEQHLKSFTKNLPELYGSLELFTGSVNAQKRKKIWDTADIIFSTPQCIANDIKKRFYDLSEVCLLIEDEAHRCTKNYDYTFVAKSFIENSENPRIIGLTASPGSDPKKIKEIMKNLSIEEVELRTRNSPDVKIYLQELEFEKREVELTKDIKEIKSILSKIYEEYTDELKLKNFLFGPPNKINLIELQRRLGSQISRNLSSPASYFAISLTAQAIKISHALELLETQTLEGFHKYMKNILGQAEKRQSKGVVKLVKREDFNFAFTKSKALTERGEEHPKVKEIIRVVRDERKRSDDPKIIIFTQFRDTASLVSKNINRLEGVNSKIFIGQAKKEGGGLSQKEQKKIIEEFSDGKTNVICATSIGEEGLDIPEVDVVIFYEPVSSAIRFIQRRGRTARLSKGKLIILITKGTKDEYAYYASHSREKKMQSSIEKIKEELKNPKKEKNESQKNLSM